MKLAFPFILIFSLYLIRANLRFFGIRGSKEFFPNFLMTTFIMFSFFQSSIISDLSSNLDCIMIENKYYLANYLIEECSIENGRYSLILVIMVFPGLFIFAILKPLISFYFIYKNRKNLSEKHIRSKIGFTIIGLSEKKFYWYINNYFN